jgi:hypothetical protein
VDGKDGPASDTASHEDEALDPERATAKWVLKRGGSLTIVPIPHAETHPQKGTSRKTEESPAESHEIHDLVELPAGTFRITGVALHGQTELRRADISRMATLPGLESLNLAETRFADAELADLRGARSLIRLDLQDTPIGDAGVAFLKSLPNLQSLRLSRSRISGAALEILKSLRSLTELHVEGTRVGDADLKFLRGMPQLIILNLARTEVKGVWDPSIRGPALHNVWLLKELTTLDLSGLHLQQYALTLPQRTEVRVRSLRLSSSKINDDALKQLSGMTSLRELWLGSTAVTGEGLKSLTWMANLEHLGLEGTGVGDPGLKELGGLKSLKSLNLQGSRVSDAGLVHLRDLRELRSLDLSGTDVTGNGVKVLRQALPNCAIES